MNNIITNSIRFFILLLLQVLIFNNVNLLGDINPMPYVLWVLLFPVKKDKMTYLLGAFTLGILVDFFSDSGGINAAASLFIAYFRLSFLKIVLQKSDIDFSSFNINTMSYIKLLYYILLLVVIHHSIVFNLEYFSIRQWISILNKTLITSAFTSFICFVSIVLFTKKQ